MIFDDNDDDLYKNYEGYLFNKKFPRTEQGFHLVVKVFKFAIWFQCYTSLVSMNQQQDALVSTLSFQTIQYLDAVTALKNWSLTYGQELSDQALNFFKEYHSTLKPYDVQAEVTSLLHSSSIYPNKKSEPTGGNGSGGSLN